MRLECRSHCKINLLLHILGKRPDGFHELETILQPVGVFDRLEFVARPHPGIELTCNLESLSTGPENLVFRAAANFLEAARLRQGVAIHLEKEIPLAAGLGGGSGNAAATLLGLNELFEQPLPPATLERIASGLGSDVPFFLQNQPALATGRGEHIRPLPPFPAFEGAWLFLVHPGFGISTSWAYQGARVPPAPNGQTGRAQPFIELLERGTLADAGAALFNSLEAPALRKFPILQLYQEFLGREGAAGTLMSGSGSATFALFSGEALARRVEQPFREQFGTRGWIRILPLSEPGAATGTNSNQMARPPR